LQLIYRIQFQRCYAGDFSLFRHNAKWTICNSPIELPLADVALIDLPVHAHNATCYVLPIAPRLLLKGWIEWGEQTSSPSTSIKGYTLTDDEAEFWLDAICWAALTELVSYSVIPDVPGIRARAKASGIAFHKVPNPEVAIAAGTKDFRSQFGVRFVSSEEYVKFVHLFVQPPEN
jgi:hypothetical protein